MARDGRRRSVLKVVEMLNAEEKLKLFENVKQHEEWLEADNESRVKHNPNDPVIKRNWSFKSGIYETLAMLSLYLEYLDWKKEVEK